MRRWFLNAGLLAALLLSLGLHRWVSWDPKKRNFEFAPDMARSPRWNAFAERPGAPNQPVLQPPVPGTVPVDATLLALAPGPEEAQRAARELFNPIPPEDPRVTSRGARLYQAFCQPCHGAGGNGDGPVVLRGFPAPPPLSGDKAVSMSDGQIFHVITFGQQNMPAYGGQIAEEERWLLVHYVRFLQRLPKK
ncbi:hypothetical protein HRbin09_00295 [bacterium HR09]|nr:hypothetical protein HRbin09_00295 [bacterium HR09]